MKWRIRISCVLCFGVYLFAQDLTSLYLMPYPSHVEITAGEFRLDDAFRISVTGNPHDRLYREATRMLRRLSNRTGLFFTQDRIQRGEFEKTAFMQIHVQQPGKVELYEDETYRLEIRPRSVQLSANTDIGALRGLETLLQLLDNDSAGYFFPCVIIQDEPRFPWRGLLIDVGRHFMPMDVIMRNLDGMAAVKLNVLHLHLTEDQGFRVECKVHPKLHELGSDGLYYTHAQIREIIQYANDRGIRVVPEFDMPGHTTSWMVGYPDLGSTPGPYTLSRSWGIQKPVMNPTSESIYAFLDLFLTEMCALFPDEYVHIGGDEASFEHWKENRDIRQFMRDQGFDDYHELQAYFNQRISKILTYYNKHMMGWDEILHPDLPKSILIQSWRGREAMILCARQGIYTILSNGYYIDLIQPADVNYLNDPLPSYLSLTETEKQFILGGEATMWSEYVTQETIDSRIWPRTAAIAERFWSPESIRDVHDMYRRLEIISIELEELGLMHEKNVDMMLRRTTRGQDITPLKKLVDVLEPVKNYQRGEQRDYTSYSPMTRMVDIVRPDAKPAREFRWYVEALSKNPTDNNTKAVIRERLSEWKDNHDHLQLLISQFPMLHEIKPLSENLLICSVIGLEALERLELNQPVKKKWQQERLKKLEKLDEPCAQTELMVVSGIEKLVEMVPVK